ncbi:type II secretion system protein [Candidatus Saccharibacteria bacterium]|nr:type II secretion system protein [Candidatus Saccharibacteria bacterium]
MKRAKHGFTLIEVAIFLAVTGLLFISVTVGVQNSIFQQRYTDSVQNFADFLRNLYSEIANVQSRGSGNSEKAIYGKLVTFGETMNLGGGSNDETSNDNASSQNIFVYDVIGGVGNFSGSGDAFRSLKALGANVVIKEGDTYVPVGIIESYKTRWAAAIQAVEPHIPDLPEYFEGTILIVRHPSSGQVYTAILKDNAGKNIVIEVNRMIDEMQKSGKEESVFGEDYLWDNSENKSHFKIDEINFCVNPNGNEPSRIRANVRIDKGTSNASGVEVIMDGERNKCNGEGS